jgi:hypothetical protein
MLAASRAGLLSAFCDLPEHEAKPAAIIMRLAVAISDCFNEKFILKFN